ncbi:tRNA dimethylallyltransferase [Roseimicrobium gellanilyticum]|uniref:tRNA dimethylallyltransferase n=1 Tax=Roseimicrobium gellanilyticum TaxID=748857 RepID=A0A366HDB6_9BACT|nr:tRNA (adenosine(37)-N6)-dimethylallyltransferase MiaA [Roseimicrobium gellanilyticum]RBP40406.1 tRNA dimethylallyltransferase [Roseimicrobium gellanilyticum]
MQFTEAAVKTTPQPFYVVGPTGSGKSALAILLANKWGGEIVNADAFQLYKGLDICTAKPTAAECAMAPHHLYGVLSPTELCDAAFYAELAKPLIADIAARGAVPIVVGGSGLYIKALTHGLSPLPSDEGLRRKLSHLTSGERVAWLLARDPHASETVNLKNDRYVTRALEICLLTGKKQSELRKAWKDRVPEYSGIQLAWVRDALHERINSRVNAMVAAGLVEEIRRAAELSATAEKAIGVQEIRDHLQGRMTLKDAIAAIQLATRQYAQRQVKWFRREKGFIPVEIEEDVPVSALVAKAEEVRMASVG